MNTVLFNQELEVFQMLYFNISFTVPYEVFSQVQ